MMASVSPQSDEVQLLECNLDDMTAEALAYTMDRLLAAGALDVWFTPIYMKKNRPATMLSVLCRPQDGRALCILLLQETTTLGVRWQSIARQVAERQMDEVETPWGLVRRKLKLLGGQVIGVKPEYDDCAKLAREHRLPLDQVVEAARHAKPIVGSGGAGDDK